MCRAGSAAGSGARGGAGADADADAGAEPVAGVEADSDIVPAASPALASRQYAREFHRRRSYLFFDLTTDGGRSCLYDAPVVCDGEFVASRL